MEIGSDLAEEALEPSAGIALASAGISVTIWRFFLPPATPKGVRSSILVGATHMALAGPNPSRLDVGIGGGGVAAFDDTGTVMNSITVVAAGVRVVVVGSSTLTVTVVVVVG